MPSGHQHIKIWWCHPGGEFKAFIQMSSHFHQVLVWFLPLQYWTDYSWQLDINSLFEQKACFALSHPTDWGLSILYLVMLWWTNLLCVTFTMWSLNQQKRVLSLWNCQISYRHIFLFIERVITVILDVLPIFNKCTVYQLHEHIEHFCLSMLGGIANTS